MIALVGCFIAFALAISVLLVVAVLLDMIDDER